MIAGVLGATGYAGAEIVRLLVSHPKIDALALSSTSFEGKYFADVYPNFAGQLSAKLESQTEVISRADVVFGALPNGLGEPLAARCMEKGIPFIDMSADFRFADEAVYKAWYGKGWENAALHGLSVYGLSEFARTELGKRSGGGARPQALIVGNPGCYPTCSSLAAWPALERGLAENTTIIVDAASGITGGGREPQRSFHFPECYDSFSPYKVGAHRHTPEIARNFAMMSGGTVRTVIFTPHLAPMNRGILATLYMPLAKTYRCATPESGTIPAPPAKETEARAAEIRAIYQEFYGKEHFVRIMSQGVYAATGRVRGSNFCDISVNIDQSGQVLIVTAAIDNMVKGAAGQAVQNMNIVFGFEESSGLNYQSALF